MAKLTFDQAQRRANGDSLAVLASSQNPDGTAFAVLVVSGDHTFKAVGYSTLLGYQNGLVTETAAGWEPVATSVLGVDLIVTYRKKVT